MDVLVTGGSGFVGNAVVRELGRAGHTVTVLVREPQPDLFADDVIVVQGDVRSAGDVSKAVANGHFDGVCHLASHTDPRQSVKQPTDCFETNIGGTVNLLSALRDEGKRSKPPSVVFASTAGVYASSSTPITELHATMPLTPYAVSKLAVEQLLGFEATLGTIGATSLRCFNVAGGAAGISDRSAQRIVPRLVGAALASLPPAVPLNPSNIVDLVHVVDVARAFVMALDSTRAGVHRVLNVGSGRGERVRDLVSLVEEAASGPVPVDLSSESGTARPAAWVADVSSISEQLGWRPLRSVAEIIHDAWFFASEGRAERNAIVDTRKS